MRFSGRTLLLVIAGIIAAFTAVSVKNRLAEAPPAPAVASTRIMVARHDLAPGNFVQSQDLDWNTVPESPEGAVHEGSSKLEDFNGAVVRRELHTGDPVPPSALTKSGEGGFMSAVLDPGMRAVSIGVTATSGNAGFISPGDHIDLIVTHHVRTSGAGTNAEESVVSETFVRNVRVLAVDQMLDNPDNKAILAKTVTVEVTPRQAEQVAVAEEMGKISAALRSLQAGDKKAAAAPVPASAESDAKPETPQQQAISDLYGRTGEENGGTRDSDISQMLEHKNTMTPHVHIIRGDQSENLNF